MRPFCLKKQGHIVPPVADLKKSIQIYSWILAAHRQTAPRPVAEVPARRHFDD